MSLLERDLAGLDNLELAVPKPQSLTTRAWRATWPKAAALVLFVALWQVTVWSGWKPEYVLASPATVGSQIIENLGDYTSAAALTLRRGITGYLLAILIGTALGVLVSQSSVLRRAVGSMITGLQTMPSIAWFPLAIVLFRQGEGAILFVVVLGAAPSIANGLLAGIDTIPPLLLRAGHVLGAKRWKSLRYIIGPAALPTYISGLRQGWAFAWRSLMAGELLVLIPGKVSLGARMDAARQFNDNVDLLAVMVVVFTIGVVVEVAVFGALQRRIHRRYGLIDEAATS